MKRQASRTHVNRTVSRKPLKNSSKLFTPNGYWLPQLFLSNGTIIRISPPGFASKATTFPSPESMQIMPAVSFRLNAHKPTTKHDKGFSTACCSSDVQEKVVDKGENVTRPGSEGVLCTVRDETSRLEQLAQTREQTTSNSREQTRLALKSKCE